MPEILILFVDSEAEMFFCLDLITGVVVASFFCIPLGNDMPDQAAVNSLEGRWLSEIIQTELGLMREELLFSANGTAKIRSLFLDNDSKCNSAIEQKGHYRVDGSKIIWEGVGKGKLTRFHRFDKQGQLVLRYQDEPEVHYVRLSQK